MKYFYYNDKGEKRGPFSGKEIKALAKGGLIHPETVIQTEEGKYYKAVGIGDVEFETYAVSLEHKPTEDGHDSGITLSQQSHALFFEPPSIPKGVDAIDERRNPGKFYDSIKNCLVLAKSVFLTLLAVYSGCFVAGLYGAASEGGDSFLGLMLMGGAFVACVFTFLCWGLVDKFLKSIRATFCHQIVIEQHAAKQTQYSQMLAEISGAGNNVSLSKIDYSAASAISPPQ